MNAFLLLLHELVPDAKTIAVLVTSQYLGQAAQLAKDLTREPAATLGVQLLFLIAGSEGEIDAAFAAMTRASWH